jgi:hypothetical protein
MVVMRKLLSNIITICFFASVLAACSVYQSSGRKAIEGQGNFAVTVSGFSTTSSAYYVCEKTVVEPDFLKEPFEVIATPFDSQKFTTLFNSSAMPSTVIVYTVTDNETYAYCHVSNISQQNGQTPVMTTKKIQKAVKVGVEQINHLLETPRP